MSIVGIISGIREGIFDIFRTVEGRADHFVKRLKRNLIRAVLQSVLVGASIVLLVAGGLMFFMRFFPADAVFVVVGLILAYLALLLNWMK